MRTVHLRPWLIWALQSRMNFASFAQGYSLSSLVSRTSQSDLEIESYPFPADTLGLIDEIDTFELPTLIPASNETCASTLKRAQGSHLWLRSSNTKLTAVDGYILYASPVLSTELVSLLLAAYDDLSKHPYRNEETQFYQFNHTNWSFQVGVANRTVPYSTITSIVTRYLRLVPSRPSGNITWTRIGCIYDDEEPVADAVILPLMTETAGNHSALARTDSYFGSHTPTRVLAISPDGTTNTTEVICPSALDIYQGYLVPSYPKRQISSVQHDMALKVFETGFYLTLRLLRYPDGGPDLLPNADLDHGILNDPQGIPAQATVLYFITVIFLALARLAIGHAVGFAFEPWLCDVIGDIFVLDSGPYRLGQLSARFILRATARDGEGILVGFKVDTLRAMANALLGPLQNTSRREWVYAVGGEILGPDSVNGTQEVVPLGIWELSVESTPKIVHDEL